MMNHREICKKLVVIVPAYNEGEQIKETISQLRNLQFDLSRIGFSLQIFVIDDGSIDDTVLLAEAAGADRIFRHKVNRGLGAAVRTGLTAARSENVDIVVKFDADLQHDPHDVLNLIQPILSGEADLVYGERFKGLQYKMPLVRRVGNMVFTALMRWLTGWPLRDSQPGIFAAERAYLQVFRLPGDYNYTQQVLLDAYHKGMRFAHVPVVFRKRVSGRSFITLRYPLKVLPQIFMVIVSVRPMRIFMPIGAVFFAAGFLVSVIQISSWFLGNTSKPIENVNFVLGSLFFGLQTMFFGVIAELIVNRNHDA